MYIFGDLVFNTHQRTLDWRSSLSVKLPDPFLPPFIPPFWVRMKWAEIEACYSSTHCFKWDWKPVFSIHIQYGRQNNGNLRNLKNETLMYVDLEPLMTNMTISILTDKRNTTAVPGLFLDDFYIQSFSLTECIVVVWVRKTGVVCLCVCVSVCLAQVCRWVGASHSSACYGMREQIFHFL